MQTTLLGVAIALIVALTAALVGPHFVDWNQFRPQFEAAAARVVGAPVRVGGDMRATLLPVPSLRLARVAVGSGGDGLGHASADSLAVEFDLGALMRGEWRATELTVNGLTLDFGLDWRGRIAWPAGMGGIDLSTLAIDRLNVTGRIALHDGASRTTLVLEDIAFAGEVRALAGALRGEGNASIDGVRYPFRISSNPTADGDGMKVHAAVTSRGQALAVDLDGELRFAASRPRFAGALTVTRGDPGGMSGLPWRAAMQIKADPAAAALEQLELAYGPGETAARFTGSGEIRFRAAPQLHAALNARQIDIDRLQATQGGGPAATASEALRGLVAALPLAPLPTVIEASAETVTLAGRPVQAVGATLRGGAADWAIDRFTALAPGATRLTVRDAVVWPGDGGGFSGAVEIAADEPDVFAAWLRGRTESGGRIGRPLRVAARVSIDAARLVAEDLKASLGDEAFGGRFVLSQLDQDAGPRLDADMRATQLDLDALGGILHAAAGDALPWPREASVTVDIAHATAGGQAVSPVALRLDYGPDAVTLHRLTFGAGAGVAVEGAGSFDRVASTGRLTLDASAPALGRFAALLDPFAPAFAARLAALPARGPARLKLAATLDKDSRPGHGAVQAQLSLDASPLKGDATLSAAPPLAAIGGIDLDALAQAAVGVKTRLAADEPGPLLALLGLDGRVLAGSGPAVLEASASGPARQPLRVTARLAAGALEASAAGTAEPFAARPGTTMAISVRKADLAPLLGVAAPFSLTGSAQVEWRGGRLAARDLDLLAGGTRLRGRLAWDESAALDGDLGLDRLSLPALFGYAMGDGADDLARLRRLQGWRGRIAFQAQRAALPGGAELRPLRGVLRADGRSLVVDALKGGIGGGEASGDLDTRRTDEGVLLSARATLAGVDAAALRYRALALPAGRVGLQMSLASQGHSTAALLGALSGSGSVTLENARIGGLAPGAFDAALAAGEGKQTVAEDELAARVLPALAAGALLVKSAEVAFTVKDGRLRAGPVTLDGEAGQAIVSGGYDIAADQFDIRATLSSTVHGSAASRPDLTLFVYGTPDAPQTKPDLSALASWLALRTIERETQRLDAIERGEARPAKTPPAPSGPAPSPPRATSVPPPAKPPQPPPPAPRGVESLPPPVEVRPAPGPAPKPRPPLSLTPQPARP